MADEKIIISDDLRTMDIPSSLVLLGVESDDDVNKIPFQMPKEYSGFDLSQFEARINYMNASGEGDIYIVDDLEVNGDDPSLMNFTWLVGRNACKFKGDTKFIVCLKKFDANQNVIQEFNTTVYSLPVLEGLETTEAVVQENPDIIEYILKLIEEAGIIDLQNYYTKEEVNALKLPNPQALTINGTPYDGTTPVELTLQGDSSSTETASGTIIHVTDAVPNEPLKSLKMYDAYGSEIYVAPIVITNKNIFRLDQIASQTVSKGITFEKSSNGAIHATGISTGTYASAQCSIDPNAFVVGQTYTLSSGKTSGELYVQLIMNYKDGTTDYLVSRNTPYTFSLAKEVSSVTGSVQITASGVTIDEWIYPMLELSDVPSEFTNNEYIAITYDGSSMPTLPNSISNIWANNDLVDNIVIEYWNDPTLAQLNVLEKEVIQMKDHSRTSDSDISVINTRVNNLVRTASKGDTITLTHHINDQAWWQEDPTTDWNNNGDFLAMDSSTTYTDFEIISAEWGFETTDKVPYLWTADGLQIGHDGPKIDYDIYSKFDRSHEYSYVRVKIKPKDYPYNTVEAEVNDIHIGADGVEYESAGDAVRNKVNIPLDEQGHIDFGDGGQLLMTKGDGSTEWTSHGTPTTEQVDNAVTEWLDDHPEATTTVEDGAITKPKLANSLKEEIEEKVDNSDIGFYKEVTLERGGTDDVVNHYIAYVPLTDDDGQQIDVYLDYDLDRNPLEQSWNKHTTLTINGNCSLLRDGLYKHGISISNGNILNRRSFEGWGNDYLLYIGIKKDRSIVEYKMDSNITPEQMLADGCWNVFNCYFKLVENGEKIDMSGGIQWGSTPVYGDTKNPLMLMGVTASNDIYFLASDGRTELVPGLTYYEAADIMISKGCVNVYNLDGGGSTCLAYKGSKVNRNIDKNGTFIRNIHYTINVKKASKNEGVLNAYAQIGFERQLGTEQVIPFINEVDSKLLFRQGALLENGTDLDDLVDGGKYYSPNGSVSATLLNCPVSNRGFTLYNMQQGTYIDFFYQFLITNPETEVYVRHIRKSDSYKGDWVKQPTRSEIEKLDKQAQPFAVGRDSSMDMEHSSNLLVVAWTIGTETSGVDFLYKANSSATSVTVSNIVKKGTRNSPTYSYVDGTHTKITNNDSDVYLRAILINP